MSDADNNATSELEQTEDSPSKKNIEVIKEKDHVEKNGEPELDVAMKDDKTMKDDKDHDNLAGDSSNKSQMKTPKKKKREEAEDVDETPKKKKKEEEKHGLDETPKKKKKEEEKHESDETPKKKKKEEEKHGSDEPPKKKKKEEEKHGSDETPKKKKKDEEKHRSDEPPKKKKKEEKHGPDEPPKKKKKEDENHGSDETPKKKNKEVDVTPQKKDESESEDEDDDEEEPRVGLLEQPIVLEAGRKRERKKVDRMSMEDHSSSKKDKSLEVPEGTGTKLGEIPRIEFKLGRILADDLKPLHRVLYCRVGTSNEIKRNIRKFCGFAFKENDTEYSKKLQQLNRFTTAMLKNMCDVVDIERSGTKESIVNRLMAFLLNPVSSGKNLPKPKRKRSSAGDKKTSKKKSKGKKEEKKKKARSPKKAAKSQEEVDDESDQDETQDEPDDLSDSEEEKSSKDDSDQDEEESEVESEPEPPKKKRNTKETPKKVPAKKQTKTIPKKEAKKATPKKVVKKTKKKVIESVSPSDSSSDNELLNSPKPPTDDELRDVIKKLLDSANLELMTMKAVCRQVYDKFPDFDLVPRKDFIKSTVKQIIR